MKSALGQWLLRAFGRAYEVRLPTPLCPLNADSQQTSEHRSTPGAESTDWSFASLRLHAGWYMLEVEHAVDSVGCVLTLLPAGSEAAHMRLGSKKVCKRIVYLAGTVRQLSVSIDQPECAITRLSLVALTSSFAMSRIQRQQVNRGGQACSASSLPCDVYRRYQTNFHNSIFSKLYKPVDDCSRQGSAGSIITPGFQTLARLEVMLFDAVEPSSCRSLAQAVDFARQRGWSVNWQLDTQPDSRKSADAGQFAFQMIASQSVTYRKDCIHRLLSAASERTVIIYADHDHVDSEGRQFDPILKPDWNPELMLNTNYIDLPWIISRSWCERADVDLFAADDSQDALLLLAALGRSTTDKRTVLEGQHSQQSAVADAAKVAALSNDQVGHVREILASKMCDHRPSPKNGVAGKSQWQRSVELALGSAGVHGFVAGGAMPGFCRVRWSLPSELPTVDIIVPSRDNVDVLKTCLDSILTRTQYQNYRIVIVDNNSCEDETEQYYQSLKSDHRITLLRYAQPFNYSAINNYAAGLSGAQILVLLNNDTEVISCDWLDELVGQALRPEVGCVGAKLYYSNGRIQHAGVVVGITGVAGHAFRYERGESAGYCGRLKASQNYSAVTAACLAVRRQTYMNVGGLDEDNLSVAWNDVDFCMKVQASGLRNVWSPYVELFHHEGLSRGADDTPEKVARVNAERQVMMLRWSLKGYEDPAYHPLLTKQNERFGLGDSLS